MKDPYSRSVSMLCSTCGGSEFEYDAEDRPFRCATCDRVYASGDELIEENGGRIDQQLDDMGAAIMKDIEKDFSKVLKKFK